MMKISSRNTILTLSASILTLWLLASCETAAQPGSAQLPWWVVAAGGVTDAAAGDVRMSATLGQPVIGPASGGTMMLHQGFWYPRATISGVEVEPGDVVAGRSALANYPNPFIGSTTIHYTLPGLSHVTLSIYTVQGELVSVLVDGIEEKGGRQVVWDGRNSRGEEMASGPYLYVLDANTMANDNAGRGNISARRIMQRLK